MYIFFLIDDQKNFGEVKNKWGKSTNGSFVAFQIYDDNYDFNIARGNEIKSKIINNYKYGERKSKNGIWIKKTRNEKNKKIEVLVNYSENADNDKNIKYMNINDRTSCEREI